MILLTIVLRNNNPLPILGQPFYATIQAKSIISFIELNGLQHEIIYGSVENNEVEYYRIKLLKTKEKLSFRVNVLCQGEVDIISEFRENSDNFLPKISISSK